MKFLFECGMAIEIEHFDPEDLEDVAEDDIFELDDDDPLVVSLIEAHNLYIRAVRARARAYEAIESKMDIMKEQK